MKNLLYYLISILLIVIASCASNKPDYSTELVFHERIEIPIDENIYYESKAIFPFNDPQTGREYLSFENNRKGQHEIVIFDLQTLNMAKRIDIKEEGPNAIFMFGHYPVNLNDYYITSGTSWTIYRINGSGEITERYDFAKASNDEILSTSFSPSWFYNPLVVKDSAFYLTQDIIFTAMGEEEWKKTPLCARLDMKSGKAVKLPLSYPVFTKGTISSNELSDLDFGYSRVFDGNGFIYSFSKKNEILVTTDHINSTWHNAKSRYIDNIKPQIESAMDVLSIMKKDLERGTYWHFIYDKYRNLYYRFVIFPCTLDLNDTKLVRTYNTVRQEFSIIIMNDKFEILGETKFSKDTYHPKMVFVGEKGLYISENNLFNESFDEDKLVFSCFVPEQQ